MNTSLRFIIHCWSCICALIFLGTPLPSNSSGFPVIDLSNLAQMLVDYEQTLAEYEHYLNQISGLQQTLPGGDWSQLSSVSPSHYGNSPLATVPTLDYQSTHYPSQVDNILQQYSTYVRPPQASTSDWQRVGINLTGQHPITQDLTRTHINASRQRDIYEQAAFNQQQSSKRQEIIKRHADLLHQLGDESDLATQQFIASQNQLMLDQLEALNATINQLLLAQESGHAQEAEKEAASYEMELQRLAQETLHTPSLIGRDRWGKL